MSNRKVKLSDSANIFHDPYSGVTICKGETVELSVAQMANKRIRSAINSGHLVLAIDTIEEKEEPKPEKTLDELFDKFIDLLKSKPSVKNISKKFSLSQLKDMATSMDFELEEVETKESIIECLIEELSAIEDKK